MEAIEIRAPDEAKRFLVQGLRLQRAVAPTAAGMRPALEWALEISSSGQPLPPIGFVADLGHLLTGRDRDLQVARASMAGTALPAGLLRAYEDHVLGKFGSDSTFERAGDVIRRLEGRDRSRAIAFVVQQFRDRAGFGGVLLSPAAIKSLLESNGTDLLNRGWESLQRHGLMPLLAELIGGLIAASRGVAEMLAPEDVFELEHGTALAELSQRIALRQVLTLTERFTRGLRPSALRTPSARRDVPTHVLDEDTYPVGGFASLSTKGSVESLLHSQLALMETEREARPDLFDIKFLRDELLYYSRDENQFLRRRRSYVIALVGDLATTRFKDPNLPAQRIILILALAVAAVRTLTGRLSADALTFHFLLPAALVHERALLAMLLREAIANGTAVLGSLDGPGEFEMRRLNLSRTSVCRALTISATEQADMSGEFDDAHLIVDGPRPRLLLDGEMYVQSDGEPIEDWAASLEQLVRAWIV